MENKNFTGVFTALVTPFNEDESLDTESFLKLLEFQEKSKVHGLVLFGSTGEAPTLELHERKILCRLALKNTKNLKIIVGAGSNCTKTACLYQKTLEDEGAMATLQVVPFYNKPTKEGIKLHFKTIAKNAKKPIILYNVPSRTGIDMPIETILELFKEEENIIGIKESNPNLEKLCILIAKAKNIRKDAVILSGEDGLFLPSMALGADGIISVASNIIPQKMLGIYNLINNNNLKEAQIISYEIIELCKSLFEYSNPIPIKTILYKNGLIKNCFRAPLCPL